MTATPRVADGLWTAHREYLTARAVADDVIAERCYFSLPTKAALQRIGFGTATPAPALVIPLWGVTGEPAGYQVRPDEPRWNGEGHPLKFEVPHKFEPRLDIHPRALAQLSDPTMPVWITEGVPKANALVSRGACAVALLGVWNWKGTALADFEYLRLKGRTVYVAFDSDVMLKPPVRKALIALGGLLKFNNAEVGYAYVPHGPEGRKQGVDDFLAAGGTLDELLARHLEAEVRRPAGENRAGAEADPYADVPDEPGWRPLGDVAAFLTRFVRFAHDDQVTAVALWIAHTWGFAASDSTPKLSIQSAEKRSGKTRLLEVIELLTRSPIRTASITPAALFRIIEALEPALLIDEVDTIWKGNTDRAEELRGLLNAGQRRGASVYRCVGEGGGQVVKEFPAYTPVALAGIGELPDTLTDRAVIIRLERRRPADTVEPFRWRFHAEEAKTLALRVGAWTQRNIEVLRAVPVMPVGVVDRAADTWEPLLAIADAAGGDWPDRSRRAAVNLNDTRPEGESSVGAQLLADIRDLFDRPKNKGRDRLISQDIVNALNANEEREYGAMHRGDGMNPIDLARMLRPFGVRPQKVRVGDDSSRGYYFDNFRDAFDRYLPPLTQTPPPVPLGTPGIPGTDQLNGAPEGGTRVEQGWNADSDRGDCSTPPNQPGTQLTRDVPGIPPVPPTPGGAESAGGRPRHREYR